MTFTAAYPALLLPKEDRRGSHVRFSDLPEALTGGADLEETLGEAADCLAEALAGRIVRGDAIPKPSRLKRGQHAIGVPLPLARAGRPSISRGTTAAFGNPHRPASLASAKRWSAVC